MTFDKKSLLLYAVTDRSWLRGATLSQRVEEALRGGATFIQLREKNLPFDEFVREGRAIGALCRRCRVPFVINDSVEVALACGADGVHVGQSDSEAGDVRQKLGPDKIIGVSAQTPEQAILAQRRGADYLGVGAVFTTSTKQDADAVSPDTLRDICRAVSIPVVAIGGIGEDNILQLRGIGLDGVAVVSAVFAQPDVEGACRRLLALSREMVGV